MGCPGRASGRRSLALRSSTLAVAAALLGACAGAPDMLPPAKEVLGRAIATPLGPAPALPDGHPIVPLAEPASNGGRVGRAPRRLDVEQLRASLLAATGHTWVASRRVLDPESPSGFTQLADADMLEALAATLGRPDYVTSTSESIEPAVTFAKLAGDAARSACRAAVQGDAAGKSPPHILVRVAARDTRTSNRPAVEANLSFLALRFWARRIAPGDPELARLADLFERARSAPASTDASGTARAAATTLDGWRAVCIAMATDLQFLTY